MMLTISYSSVSRQDEPQFTGVEAFCQKQGTELAKAFKTLPVCPFFIELE